MLDPESEQGAEKLLTLVAPPPPGFSSEDNEPLRPAAGELRVSRDFASARCSKRDSRPSVGTRDGSASASKWRDYSVASQHKASPFVVAP